MVNQAASKSVRVLGSQRKKMQAKGLLGLALGPRNSRKLGTQSRIVGGLARGMVEPRGLGFDQLLRDLFNGCQGCCMRGDGHKRIPAPSSIVVPVLA